MNTFVMEVLIWGAGGSRLCPHDALKSENLYPENSPSTEELWDKNQCQGWAGGAGTSCVCATMGQPRGAGVFKGCLNLDDPIVLSPLGCCRV